MSRRITQGPVPSEIPLPCPDCGKVRWYSKKHISKLKTHRCSSCTTRAYWRNQKLEHNND